VFFINNLSKILFFMTRILRFLLIAAVAWPLWQPAAAQNAVATSGNGAKESLMRPKPTNLEMVVTECEEKSDPIHKQDVSVKSHTENLSKTVCDGSDGSTTTTNKYVPINGYYLERTGTYGQMIYPASALGLQKGDVITKITFYGNSEFTGTSTLWSSGSALNTNVTLRLGKTTETAITSSTVTTNRSGATEVFTGTIPGSANDYSVTFTFTNDYTYDGDNLIVDLYRNDGSNYTNNNYAWYGVSSSSGSSYYHYSNTTSGASFLPKMTIYYTRVVPDPYEATFEGNGEFGKVVVNQTGRATFTVTNTGANPFTPVVTLTGDQEFSVRSNGYGDLDPGVSRFYLVTFAPTELGTYSGTITLTAEESEAAVINSSILLSGTGSETKDQAVGEGSDEETLPVNLYYMETANHGQIIYLASDLNLTSGTLIKKITFHANGNLQDKNGGTSSSLVTLKIGETTQSTYSSAEFLTTNDFTNGFASTSGTNIYTGTNTVTFEFSGDGYEYQGGNLVVDASCAAGGTYTLESLKWLGVNKTTNVGVLQYSSNDASLKTFLPWITIDCVPGEIKGRDNELVVLDPDDWNDFSYDWYMDGNTANEKHTNTLGDEDPATEPDQIIAMLREVYMNPNIPGNKKRGFTETGRDDHDNKVLYTGVGELERTGTGQSGARFVDTFGWNIPSTEPIIYNTYTDDNNYTWHVWKMDQYEYEPTDEGLTLLLIEMKDNFTLTDIKDDNGTVVFPALTFDSSLTGYAQLREYISKTIKSARIIKNAKRTGSGLDAGTLFKIDCKKLNKFYLIAKGQLAMFHSMRDTWKSGHFEVDPCYNYCTNYSDVDRYVDPGVDPDYSYYFFLGHMFEQFSPSLSQNAGETTGAKDDIYQDLINMHSFGVIHDCPNVPYVGHHFMMYGADSKSEDCQDVTDMMLFVPDYRMMDWEKRGTKNSNNLFIQDYFRYNAVMQPTMGLYVIRQNEITPTTEADDYYMLNLNWVTNLDNFLPSDQQEFELLEVVVNDTTGVESYVPVYYMNEQGKYTDAAGNEVDEANKVPIVLTMSPGREKNYPNVYVKRENASKQVTYAIRGRDVTIENGVKKHFLSLQISNRQSYIIPGTDPTELVLLKDATHYSRFDAERVRNAYSNKIVMNNSVDGMKQSVLESNNVQMAISRVAQVPAGSTAGVSTDPVTIATITFNPSAKEYTVQMANQAVSADSNKDPETEFPVCADGSIAGYHANNGGTVQGNGSWTGTYYVTDDNIDLGKLEIFDNFVQAIPNDNTHPFGYIYNVTTTYPCPSTPTSVYMSVLDVASTINAGNPVYYANTWNDGDTEAQKLWVKGVNMDDNNILFKFTPVKDNIIFVRMDPAVENEGNEPNWGLKWNQSPDLRTSGNMGKTYYIHNDDYIWDMSGGWSGDITADNAHGNTFRIPIYKTSSQINGSFAQTAVEDDTEGTLGLVDGELPTNFEFGVGVQYISKTEILRYDTYRWPEGDPRYSVASADGDDEQDLPPTGLAMNQGEYYSISMNPDTDNETNGQVTVSSGSGTATFVDEVPAASSDAGAYIYAPIVEAFSGRGEGDYNSYGGPLQSAAVGKLNAGVTPPDPRDDEDGYMSRYNWTDGDGNKYAYYKVTLTVSQKDVPEGYQLYKVRAWRQVENAASVLGEEYEALNSRMGANVKFVDVTFDTTKETAAAQRAIDAATDELGAEEDHITVHNPQTDTDVTINFNAGTFGARKVGNPSNEEGVIEQLDMNFKVRMYFTRLANLTTTRDAASGKDDKFYIVEQEIPFTLNSDNIITGVENMNISREVVGVKYYNVAGIESDKPFQGVNIVVTRYSDGSTTTTKILK
jgi:hypothetical protein